MLLDSIIQFLFPSAVVRPVRPKQLKVIGEEVFFFHRGQQYQIGSHPSEPCTYIMLNGEIIRTIHVAFEVAEIRQMIRTGYMMTAANGHFIRTEQMRHILAWVIDSDRAECDFVDAELKTDKTIIPHFVPIERESVCMGDDAHAPQRSQLRYYCDTLLSDLMTELLSYLPDMRCHKWEIMDHDRHLATLSFSSTGVYNNAKVYQIIF